MSDEEIFPKTLDEMGFKKKTKEKIHEWLVDWLSHIDFQNDIPNTMRPRRIDFKKWSEFA